MRDATRGLIGPAALALVKTGAILVNTARAGLDVYSHDAPQGPLAATGRVIFTPHLGGATVEALRRTAVGSVSNVLTALAGRTPATALNAPVGGFGPVD